MNVTRIEEIKLGFNGGTSLSKMLNESFLTNACAVNNSGYSGSKA